METFARQIKLCLRFEIINHENFMKNNLVTKAYDSTRNTFAWQE